MVPLAPENTPLVGEMAKLRKAILFVQGVVQPSGGAVTVSIKVHELLFPAQSKIVQVIGVEPGPTGVPADGFCTQIPRQQSSFTQLKLR